MGGDEAPSCLPKIEDRLKEQPELTGRLDVTQGDLILGVSSLLEDNSLGKVLSLKERLGHGARGEVEIAPRLQSYIAS